MRRLGSPFVKVVKERSFAFLVLYLESAFKFGNLTFETFGGFSFEGIESVVIESEHVAVGGSFGLHPFLLGVIGNVGFTFSIDFNFGSLKGFDKEGFRRGGDGFLSHEVLGSI